MNSESANFSGSYESAFEGVINNLAASYVGSNNYALLTGNSGGFGCRISPRPSAGRYTRIKLSDVSKKLFLDIDNNVLEKQFFEGQYIEPKFLMPVFPVMFLNGSNGMWYRINEKKQVVVLFYIYICIYCVLSWRVHCVPAERQEHGVGCGRPAAVSSIPDIYGA